MPARYQVREDYDDEPRGTAVDLVPPKQAKAQKPNQEFDDLERGTFRNDPPVTHVDEDEGDEDEPRGRQDEDDQDDQDDQDDDRDTRRERQVDRGRQQDESIRKRLARERRLREEASEDAEYFRERTETLERRLNSIESKMTSGEAVATLERERETLQSKLADIKVRLKQAKEAGDVDLEVDLSTELAKVGGDIQVNAYKIEDAKKSAAAATTAKPGEEPNRHLAKWKRRHGAWFANPVNQQIAAAIEKEVLATGSNVRTEAHFREITKRLAKLNPKEFSVAREYGGGESNTRRSPVNGGNDNESGSRPASRYGNDVNIQIRNGKAYITPEHEEIMRKFGLDPEDPNDVNSFVRENVKTRK